MTPLNDRDETLALLRDLPVEVDLEQVAHMVAAFPLAVSATGWLASLKTNLNSILMISIGTIIVGTAIRFMAAGTPIAQTPLEAQVPQIVAPTPVSEAPQAKIAQPAVILALPAVDTARALAPAEAVPREPAAMPAPDSPALTVATPLALPMSPMATPLLLTTPSPIGTTEKTYDVKDFNAIASFCDGEISVEEGPWSVTATGDQDRLEGLEIKVTKGVLKITMKKNKSVRLTNQGTVKVEVHLPQLTRIEQGGSGNIKVGELNSSTKDLAVHVLGSGNVDLQSVQVLGELTLLVQGSGDINCRSASILGRASATVMGSGEVKASGTTPIIEVLIQGDGNVDVSGMKAQDGNVTILGSGNASVNCSGKLERLVQGSGTIQNAGSASSTGDSDGK
jgi:hypothetical protein